MPTPRIEDALTNELNVTVFLASLVVTLVVTPFVADGLRRTGSLDVPNLRSSHSGPVPRGAGIACMTGVAVGVVVARPELSTTLYLVLASIAVLSAVGLVDDLRSLSPMTRLILQAGAGAVVGAPFGLFWALGAAALFVVVVNCINFMDGINGITSATMLTWGLTLAYLAESTDVALLGTLGLVTAATALGFLPWNAPKARIFLGDVGSYLYGALVGSGTVLAIQSGVPIALTLSPLLVYLFDVGLTLLRRAHRGAPIFTAHREHIYQRLTAELGLSHAQVTAYVFALNLIVILLWMTTPGYVAGGFTAVLLLGYSSSVVVGRRMLLPRAQRQPT